MRRRERLTMRCIACPPAPDTRDSLVDADHKHYSDRLLGLKIQLVNPGFVRTPLTDKNKFPMPFLMEVEDAADRLVEGLRGSAFEITFPRRLAYGLKLLRGLPYRLYFPLIRRGTGL